MPRRVRADAKEKTIVDRLSASAAQHRRWRLLRRGRVREGEKKWKEELMRKKDENQSGLERGKN